MIPAVLALSQQAGDPKELSSLRESYSKARAAAVAPIDKKYVDVLLVLKDKFTKSGNLEAAIATDEELKRIRGANPEAVPADELPAAAGKTVKSRKLYRELAGTKWHTEWGDQTPSHPVPAPTPGPTRPGPLKSIKGLSLYWHLDAAQRVIAGWLGRMWDVSQFMKTLKQRFTQWFNKRHRRKGTLWEDRFRSVLVEGGGGPLAVMAAYIDLNPVRAGIVEDPKDYRWCGYGEAVAGIKLAHRFPCPAGSVPPASFFLRQEGRRHSIIKKIDSAPRFAA